MYESSLPRAFVLSRSRTDNNLNHRVWLIDGVWLAFIGWVLFAVYVGAWRGGFGQWPQYTATCLIVVLVVSAVPYWRGGPVDSADVSFGVARAVRVWVFVWLGIIGFMVFLGVAADLSRVWLLAWALSGGGYIIVSRIRYMGRLYSGPNARRLFGLRVSAMTNAEATRVLDAAYTSGDVFKVAFANANTINLTNRLPAFRKSLSEFLVLNDGIGVDIASYLRFGQRFPQNLNGTDFVPRYLERSRYAYRVFLLGAEPDVVVEAAQVLQERYPRHAVVGLRHGYFAEADVRKICSEIREARADVVLVALGSPAQETWIAKHGEATGAALLFGVGGLFDFLAGHAVRAPIWMRRIRLEWVYRLVREPRRLWRRYLVGNLAFLRDTLLETRH